MEFSIGSGIAICNVESETGGLLAEEPNEGGQVVSFAAGGGTGDGGEEAGHLQDRASDFEVAAGAGDLGADGTTGINRIPRRVEAGGMEAAIRVGAGNGIAAQRLVTGDEQRGVRRELVPAVRAGHRTDQSADTLIDTCAVPDELSNAWGHR